MRNDLTAQGTFLPSVNQAISLSICWLLCIPEDLSLSETAVWRTRGVTDRAGVTSSSEWLQPWGDLPHLRVPLWGTELTFFLRPAGENLCLLLQLLAVCRCSLIYLHSQMCTLCTCLCPNLPFHGKYTVPVKAHLVNMGFFFSGREFNSVKSLYQSSKSSRN